MDILEFILIKLIGLTIPLDLLIFLTIIFLIHKFSEIKNWGIKLLLSVSRRW